MKHQTPGSFDVELAVEPVEEEPRACERPRCPVCGAAGVEKKQKWFCGRCGQLIATCCD